MYPCPRGHTSSKETKGSSVFTSAGGDQLYSNKAYLLFLDGCNFMFVQSAPVQENFKLLNPVSNTCRTEYYSADEKEGTYPKTPNKGEVQKLR